MNLFRVYTYEIFQNQPNSFKEFFFYGCTRDYFENTPRKMFETTKMALKNFFFFFLKVYS